MLGDARPRVAGLSPLCALQNGVISLIDCTLVEEPESTDEDGRCWGAAWVGLGSGSHPGASGLGQSTTEV